MGTEDDHVERTIATYDVIAPHYHVTATPELRDWEESSMRLFANYLGGTSVLVPGCGDGRDSRYLLHSVLMFFLSTCLRECLPRRASAVLQVDF
jgi:hypothetical protein